VARALEGRTRPTSDAQRPAAKICASSCGGTTSSCA
jgi:hypothetical protein